MSSQKHYTRQQLCEILGPGYGPADLFNTCRSKITLKDKCIELIGSVKCFREDIILLASQGADMLTVFSSLLGEGKNNYPHIMNELRNYTGIPRFEFGSGSAEKIECICVAIDALVRDLEELARTERVGFGEIWWYHKQVLEEYLRISKRISQSEEIKVLEEKMLELNTASASKPYSPFVFVCASSGTGKTNMAFSLNTPSLYFLSAYSCNQYVYQGFYSYSSELHELIDDDFRIHKGSVAVDDVYDSNLSYKLVGYLVELIIMVDTMYHSAEPRKNAAELQVSINQIEFKAMTLAEGRLALEQHFKTGNYFFPIVFDESSMYLFDPSKIVDDIRVRKFIFAGSIMRCLRCMPIFIYVNFQAGLYLEYSKSKATDDGECSFLLWHRPPGVAETEMSERFATMNTLISQWRGDKQFPSEKLMKFLEKYLLRERPLFLEYAESFIKYCCENKDKYCVSDEEFLALLVEDMLDQFRIRKSNFPLLNCGQLAYMTAYTHNTTEDVLEEEWYELDAYIDGHFGYLAAKSDDPQFPSYTSIARNCEGKLSYLKDGQDFQIRTRFEPFHEAPLTGLIVTGVTADNARLLCGTSYSKEREIIVRRDSRTPTRIYSGFGRFSIVSAIDKTLKNKSSVEKYSKTPLGFKLELTLFASAILASRGGGFKGCPFQLFLEMLVREFDFEGEYCKHGMLPSAIKIHEDFPEPIRMKRIPFLASMAVECWNKTLADELKELFGANLGIARASVQDNSGDLVVIDSADNSVILVGECKMQAAPVNVGYLKKRIIDKFAKYPGCDLCLFVGPRFANLPTFHEPETETVIWVFERKEDGLHLVPAQTKKPQNMKARKHAIILDIWKLSGVEAEKKLKGIIAKY